MRSLKLLSLLTIGSILVGPELSKCLAQDFPNRPITIIVNYGAGGSTDVAVRLLAKVAEKRLGVPLVISNKPGGGGVVGTAELARAKPDGYTIGTLTIGALSAVPSMQQVPYQPFKDFDFISGFGRYLYAVFVKTNSPFQSIKEVVEAGRKSPGKLTYGSMSVGIAIGLKYLEAKENIKMTYIPLQSGQETATSLIGGHTQMAIGGMEIYQFVLNKEARGLAALTEERWPHMPDVPTMKELGYDIDLTGWMAFGAPAGVTTDRIRILYEAFKVASNDPEVKANLEKLKLSAPYISGEEAKKIYQQRALEWKPLIDGLKADQTKK